MSRVQVREMYKLLERVEVELHDFPLMGEAGQPGYLVVTLAQLEKDERKAVTLERPHRESLARDWKAGLKFLKAHRDYLREEVKTHRRRGWWDRTVRVGRARDQRAGVGGPGGAAGAAGGWASPSGGPECEEWGLGIRGWGLGENEEGEDRALLPLFPCLFCPDPQSLTPTARGDPRHRQVPAAGCSRVPHTSTAAPDFANGSRFRPDPVM